MRTLGDVREGLRHGATAAEAARCAKLIASDADTDTLLKIVSMLADAVITPAKRTRGGQPNPPPSVVETVNGNIALSEYARLVNARDILDERKPRFPAYAKGMDAAIAKQHLMDWKQPIKSGRQGCERRYGECVCKRYKITHDAWETLKRNKLRKINSVN